MPTRNQAMYLTKDLTNFSAVVGPQPAMPTVAMKHVSLKYGDMLALDDATLEIAAGEFVAVVGPSGCGKSTLMKLVTGLIPPTAGEIHFDGNRVDGPIHGAGMAFQNATLLPWRTTTDNVMLPLEIVEPFKSQSRSQRKLLATKVQKLLEIVGLGEFGDRLPWQLSGGMQQRANLCRALVHEPKLLMLDEPFAALDAFTKEDLWQVLQKLWMRQKFTGILVTHDLREAVYLADTVYVMSNRPGRILHRCSILLPRPRTAETTFNPLYTDLVNDLRAKIAAARNTK
ncbi:MAG: nitrate transporter ATP-binding protein [Rhodospirillales bacterium]|nr:nitrate transporter ATP-binding protein [Rhodospirillales bacterium]